MSKVLQITLYATAIEWTIYYLSKGFFGIEVMPSQFMLTILFMIVGNYMSAKVAKKILIGKW